MKCIDQELDRL